MQLYLSKRKLLYCDFIGLRKTFDSDYRNRLINKLYFKDTNAKKFRIIRSMYTNVKGCAKNLGTTSDLFESCIGLKQGEVLSPLLFSLFITDLENVFARDMGTSLSLLDIKLVLVLFLGDKICI